jgi:hypothetical protein
MAVSGRPGKQCAQARDRRSKDATIAREMTPTQGSERFRNDLITICQVKPKGSHLSRRIPLGSFE